MIERKVPVIKNITKLTSVDTNLTVSICEKILEVFNGVDTSFDIIEFSHKGYFVILTQQKNVDIDFTKIVKKLETFVNIFWYDIDFFSKDASLKVKCYYNTNISKEVKIKNIKTKSGSPKITHVEEIDKAFPVNFVLSLKDLLQKVYTLLVPFANDDSKNYTFEFTSNVVNGFRVLIKNCNSWTNNLLEVCEELNNWEILVSNMKLVYNKVNMFVSLKQKEIVLQFSSEKILGKRKRTVEASEPNKRSKTE